MTSSNGNIFCVTGLLRWKFPCQRWIPLTNASDAELWCFLYLRRWSVNSLTKATNAELWCFFGICAWTNDWVNNRYADDLGRHRARYDVTVMKSVANVNSGIYVWGVWKYCNRKCDQNWKIYLSYYHRVWLNKNILISNQMQRFYMKWCEHST